MDVKSDLDFEIISVGVSDIVVLRVILDVKNNAEVLDIWRETFKFKSCSSQDVGVQRSASASEAR